MASGIPLSGCPIRLVSQYLCPFTSNNLISELIKYKDSQITLNVNIAMYFIDNINDLNFDKRMNRFIKKNVKTMLEMILDSYDKNRFERSLKGLSNMLIYLTNKFCIMTPSVIDQHCWTYGVMDYSGIQNRVNKIDLNLIDYIALQACIKRNKQFLDDFVFCMRLPKVASFYYKYEFNGHKIPYRYKLYCIATRDLVDILLCREDLESLDFLLSYFGLKDDHDCYDFFKIITDRKYYLKGKKCYDYCKSLVDDYIPRLIDDPH